MKPGPRRPSRPGFDDSAATWKARAKAGHRSALVVIGRRGVYRRRLWRRRTQLR